jgi:hypothetical protein
VNEEDLLSLSRELSAIARSGVAVTSFSKLDPYIRLIPSHAPPAVLELKRRLQVLIDSGSSADFLDCTALLRGMLRSRDAALPEVTEFNPIPMNSFPQHIGISDEKMAQIMRPLHGKKLTSAELLSWQSEVSSLQPGDTRLIRPLVQILALNPQAFETVFSYLAYFGPGISPLLWDEIRLSEHKCLFQLACMLCPEDLDHRIPGYIQNGTDSTIAALAGGIFDRGDERAMNWASTFLSHPSPKVRNATKLALSSHPLSVLMVDFLVELAKTCPQNASDCVDILIRNPSEYATLRGLELSPIEAQANAESLLICAKAIQSLREIPDVCVPWLKALLEERLRWGSSETVWKAIETSTVLSLCSRADTIPFLETHLNELSELEPLSKAAISIHSPKDFFDLYSSYFLGCKGMHEALRSKMTDEDYLIDMRWIPYIFFRGDFELVAHSFRIDNEEGIAYLRTLPHCASMDSGFNHTYAFSVIPQFLAMAEQPITWEEVFDALHRWHDKGYLRIRDLMNPIIVQILAESLSFPEPQDPLLEQIPELKTWIQAIYDAQKEDLQ